MDQDFAKHVVTAALIGFSAMDFTDEKTFFLARKAILENVHNLKVRLSAYRLLWHVPTLLCSIIATENTSSVCADLNMEITEQFLTNLCSKIPPANHEIFAQNLATLRRAQPKHIVPYTNSSLELVITIGIAGSGKSTFCDNFFPDYKRVNMDKYRGMLSLDPADKLQGGLAFDYCYPILESHLQKNQSVIWDATSITAQTRSLLTGIGEQYGAKISLAFFDLPLDVVLQRNSRRTRWVPDESILRQFKQLEVPHAWEAHRTICVGLYETSDVI